METLKIYYSGIATVTMDKFKSSTQGQQYNPEELGMRIWGGH